MLELSPARQTNDLVEDWDSINFGYPDTTQRTDNIPNPTHIKRLQDITTPQFSSDAVHQYIDPRLLTGNLNSFVKPDTSALLDQFQDGNSRPSRFNLDIPSNLTTPQHAGRFLTMDATAFGATKVRGFAYKAQPLPPSAKGRFRASKAPEYSTKAVKALKRNDEKCKPLLLFIRCLY